MKEFCAELECELKNRVENLEMFKQYAISVFTPVYAKEVIVIQLNDIDGDKQNFCEVVDWRSSFKLFGETYKVRIVVNQGSLMLFKNLRDLFHSTERISDELICRLKQKYEEGANNETN